MRTRAESSPRRRRIRIDSRAFEATLEIFKKDLARRHSHSLLEQSQQAASLFFDFLRVQRIQDLREVSDAHVIAYARQLAKTKSSRGTIYALATQRWHLGCLQRFFRFLENQGIIFHNPTLDLDLPSWRKLPRTLLNQDQARRLMAHPDPRTKRGQRSSAILELLYGTGIRVGECERLDIRDLDLAQGLLFIRDGKGRKDRVVPIVGRAASALDLYLRDARLELVNDPREQALFLTRQGTRVKAKNIQFLVRMNARSAEIPMPLSPHQLRHACATHLLKGGADVRHVQKLLGHQSLDSTAIYTHVALLELKHAVEKAHPREKNWKRKRKTQQ